MGNQPLVSVVYTSVARQPLYQAQLAELRQRAIDLNAIDGITGALLFDGARFVQLIEGSDLAVDDLLRRLADDPRHHHFEVIERSTISQRMFPHWGMMLIMVGADGVMRDASALDAPFPEQQARLASLLALLRN